MTESATGGRHRNTAFMVRESAANYRRAIQSNLMQVSIRGRNNKRVVLPDDREVVEFVNCSYLGLDLHPSVIAASKGVDPQWGANFCCARSRFSIEPQRQLEEELSELYGGRVVTFPSTSAAHISIMPLLASGILFDEVSPPKVTFIFDQFAHSSMQFLKPVLATEATVTTVPHNSLDALRIEVEQAKRRGEVPVYVADGIYSMGGLCPVAELMALAVELDFYLYIDDAHGLTIFGDRGEGLVLSQVAGTPERLILTFSLSKGFGAYGGGLLVANERMERLVRSYGQIYSFSAAQTFQAVNACRAVVRLHHDDVLPELRRDLRARVALFDELMGDPRPFSPIRMVQIGNEEEAISAGERLLDEGYFVSVVFFPIVRRNVAQLRLCIAANHSVEDIVGIVDALGAVGARPVAAEGLH
ncbi:aminotransferase class I/II-fold pyridoxal phosphate-dependent enzyme [Frankia sp. AgB32]|uniref:aminotransferase class I/II-fold pyridoxal phosphate-dependent enzyme n=1 Tax=Frankia sp. AgB32 TaxID=631119 RepID=UPI00200BD7C9|nr:aminotransferase class I/II-fold pyridoxal phosphate-dependent enzyme [Frankia sp. AgB32]MCK9893963.1 aminotransferase class I/II-fold pyridoxal phosphate-dependent enzyme [Frankia sp. AgB32]